MTKLLNTHLDHICLNSADPEMLARFYGEALDMEVSQTGAYWQASGPGRALLFARGMPNSLSFGAYATSDEAEFAKLQARAEAKGAIRPASSPLLDIAFAVADPDGNHMEFGLKPDAPDAIDSPGARLQHLVVATTNVDQMIEFYADTLGYVMSDEVYTDAGDLTSAFLRADSEHHCFAIFRADRARLDHHCYETTGWNDIRDWSDRFASYRIPLIWGPGRHGPGNNLFCMIQDPEQNWIEMSAELEVCDRDRATGVWPHEERTLNSWGHGKLRS